MATYLFILMSNGGPKDVVKKNKCYMLFTNCSSIKMGGEGVVLHNIGPHG